MEEKENRCSNLDFRKPNPKSSDKVRYDVKKPELNEFFSPLPSPKEKLKRLGFWSKKLQDLEENETKNKKFGVYEFSGTDEPGTSFKIKKKSKENATRKKRKAVVPKCNRIKKTYKEKKIKQTDKQAMDSKQITLSKREKKLAEKGEKSTFSTALQTIGITSTPAMNKNNLIAASNFLFLSPIIKEEAEYRDNVTECSPLSMKAMSRSPFNFNKQTPKIETKLKRLSCRRVLRSGKMLDIS